MRLLLVVSGFALLAACNESTSSATGKLGIAITDAPFQFDQVARADMHVVRIDAREAVADSMEAANTGSMTGWTTILTPNETVDILDLTGGRTTDLGTAFLPVGTYRGFRLVLNVNQSSITLKDGTPVDIVWPSAGSSGIKINLDQPVVITEDSSRSSPSPDRSPIPITGS
jgi:hypothetical protein